MLNKHFDKIYYINLDRRQDRRRDCEAQLLKYNIIAERVTAYDTASMGISGAIGCHKSHIKVLKDAYKKGYNKILLLEDDIVFTKEFDNFASLPSPNSFHWDMLYLGATIMKKPIIIDEHIMRVVKAFAAHAIAFTWDMIGLIIEKDTDPSDPVDNLYASFHPTHNCIAYRKPLVIQKQDEWSDIEQRIVNYQFVSH